MKLKFSMLIIFFGVIVAPRDVAAQDDNPFSLSALENISLTNVDRVT